MEKKSSFLSALSQANSAYALILGGQGSSWESTLQVARNQTQVELTLQNAWQQAKDCLESIKLDLLKITPDLFEQIEELLGADTQPGWDLASPSGPGAHSSTEGGPRPTPAVRSAIRGIRPASASVPGILLAQLAALIDLRQGGLELQQFPPQLILGHSQGILGAELARAFIAEDREKIASLLSLAVLIGVAGEKTARQAGVGAQGKLSPMLSVRGIGKAFWQPVLDRLSTPSGNLPTLAVINGPRAVVFSGAPKDLQAFRQALESEVQHYNQAIEQRRRGGEVLRGQYDYLEVSIPFHCPLLAPAVELVQQWGSKLPGLTENQIQELATQILLDPTDWEKQLSEIPATQTKWALDLGPGKVVSTLSEELLAGSGSAMVEAGTFSARDQLATPGYRVAEPLDYRRFAPRLVELPDGKTVLDTAFTRLTGYSPIMLPAMTPTTVDAEIVAAAANAGNWAELAGGGQYSPEVFAENKANLVQKLTPGRVAGFSTMFFDRYMWNLQFGTEQMVPKARRSGAPIDAVVISAGIPDLEQANQLIASFKADGFTHLCFKPGTVDQIEQVLQIAQANPDTTLIMQVEDGHSGGHHSWENLDDLLLAVYHRIRATENIVLTVGGGIGTPQKAARYLDGSWAHPYGKTNLPVDAVFIGTAAMTVKEAKTSAQVKQLLVETPGISETDDWVGRGEIRGGMTSGVSHLDADIHEIANDSAAASKLIHQLGANPDLIAEHREELIAALDKSAKPYFGNLEEMTYYQWAKRVVELAYPYADWTWQDRVLDLFRRIEARMHPQDHGAIPTLFADLDQVEDAPDALERLVETYPDMLEQSVSPLDAAWFVQLCRKHHKPFPFVPVLDSDLARWWGLDTLWQSQDPRFPASAVRVIPGPVSVGGIDRVDEPIGELFARFEQAAVSRLQEQGIKAEQKVFSRFANATDPQSFLRQTPHLVWNGNLVDNPAYTLPNYTRILPDHPEEAALEPGGPTSGETLGIAAAAASSWKIVVDCDSSWDYLPEAKRPFYVKQIEIPLQVSASCQNGGYPVVDLQRLSVLAYDLLAGAAGITTLSTCGDKLNQMPAVKADGSVFGLVEGEFTWSNQLGVAHGQATAGNLKAQLTSLVPDALVGPCWPTIYQCLGTARYQDYAVIEGLLNAVHLDHSVRIYGELPQDQDRVQTRGHCVALDESASGRIVEVRVELLKDQQVFAELIERFAIRGRVASHQAPPPSPSFWNGKTAFDTKRSFLRQAYLQAPADMTAFANVSGDFNPIHTSYAAARLSGLSAPLVHGMWLSALCQHLICADGAQDQTEALALGEIAGQQRPLGKIISWTYEMFGMVNLGDTIELSAWSIGHTDQGEQAIEVSARINGMVVAQGHGLLAAPKVAYVYPGQGIQRPGMGMENSTGIMAEIWQRADQFTRAKLGFSIRAIVRDNPKELRVGSQVLRHPQGVLNLTQFTQVALATLAYGQTQELKAAGVFNDHSYYAGHSLGEYNALAACAEIFPLETVLEIVYQRGSAMHNLVERDTAGRSNYQMGALRPNQFGVSDQEVVDYIEKLAAQSNEFLEIVNFNLAGEQYAVAGTVRGLKYLAADASAKAAAFGGKNPFMLIPGIDVPFHSSVLRSGVPAFRAKLQAMLPQKLKLDQLVGRYIPNLVARPFELTEEFARSILQVVPSQAVEDLLKSGWEQAEADRDALGRTLLIELLAWQFASPVRWIETQALLMRPDQLGISALIEVGLGTAPTLANLAAKTLKQWGSSEVSVWNTQRDQAQVFYQVGQAGPHLSLKTAPGVIRPRIEVGSPTPPSEANSAVSDTARTSVGTRPEGAAASAAVSAPANQAASGETSPAAQTKPQAATGSSTEGAAEPKSSPSAKASVGGAEVNSGGNKGPAEVSLTASGAIKALLAWSNRLTLEQISPSDTVESLTGGVSSKRNQLLMDMAAELDLPNIEGAAEAQIEQLGKKVDQLAKTYRPFGSVLNQAIESQISQLFGAARLRRASIAQHLQSHWQLPESWVGPVEVTLLLESRDGQSVRGGVLGRLPASVNSPEQGKDLIDQAVQLVAQAHGIALQVPGNQTSAGAVIDEQALQEVKDKLLGPDGALTQQAQVLVAALGKDWRKFEKTGQIYNGQHLGLDSQSGLPHLNLDPEAEKAKVAAELAQVVLSELGVNWAKQVAEVFDPAKAVLLDDSWAWVREDLARVFNREISCPDLPATRFVGFGQQLADLAQWYQSQSPDLAQYFGDVARQALTFAPGRFASQVALVTGAAPDSIAAQVVAGLLKEGATVVMTASRLDQKRLHFAKDLYHRFGSVQAKLWVVPANLGSLRDVDQLIGWIGSEQTKAAGAKTELVKPALLPDLFFPFAAPKVYSLAGQDPFAAQSQARILLWGVERAIWQLSQLGVETAIDHRLHVVLPGSPNRGTFGNDGAYGEAKAAFDVLVNKWKHEPQWAGRVTLAHPLIGWVKGTSLMGGNDRLVPLVEQQGITVYRPEEIAARLLDLASGTARQKAVSAPLTADLSGGLLQANLDLSALAQQAKAGIKAEAALKAEGEAKPNSVKGAAQGQGQVAPSSLTQAAPSSSSSNASSPLQIEALPNLRPETLATPLDWKEVPAGLEDLIVIVGTGEISAWGSRRTRHQAEYFGELTAAGVIEMAWMMGLISWNTSPAPGWYDRDDQRLEEAQIYQLYRDQVLARSGIRSFNDDSILTKLGSNDVATVYLETDQEFSVSDQAQAEAYLAADPDHTQIWLDDQQWKVRKLAGAAIQVPRRATLSRTVGGQIPQGFDPAHWGIPANMIENLDRLAVWNLITAVDAFVSAGFSPAELLNYVHPSQVSSTQGTGVGGMESLRDIFLSRFLGKETAPDILQEALPNVIAAHAMQSYLGGYGQMVHPVGACATAAISVESGIDKLRLGKSQFVLAGGIDDISVESLTGFGQMNATADSAKMYQQGIEPQFFSRASDRRRGGFIEAQGGGALLLTTGKIALQMGLPVLGVVAYGRSFADGAHTSIPAPGIGVLAAGMSREHSDLARSLQAVGLTADDVQVISKHDTSTLANDPNEAELHSRLWAAIGRDRRAPLYVISQKTVTGHAKAGAALFQLAGLCEVFRDQLIPPNRALDCVDPQMKAHTPLVWLREKLDVSARPIKAAALTSLGFGHVAALIVLAHPTAFRQAVRQQLGAKAEAEWARRAQQRLDRGHRQFWARVSGGAPLYQVPDNRRFPADQDLHDLEVELLLDPQARLSPGGYYQLPGSDSSSKGA